MTRNVHGFTPTEALVALALCTLCVASGAQAPEDTPRPPNVILIMADDLGYGEVGCYGQEKIRTPSIDRIAREGMRFTQAYSGSCVCAPSRCVLLTGKHTGHAHIRDNRELREEGQLPIPAETVTLAEMFRDAGYATGAIGKWGLGATGSTGDPNAQGFDHWFGYICQRQAHNQYPVHLWRNGEKVILEGNEPRNLTGKHYAHDLMAEEALGFVRDHAREPFFLYLPFHIPHAALQVPADSLAWYEGEFPETAYDGKKGYLPHPTPRAAYAAMVSRMDRDIGRVLDLLEELGIAGRTLVIFTSDNGPTFNGGTDSAFFESTAGLRGLKCSLYEGGIRVPLVARWPGTIEAGSETDHVAAFEDFVPTLGEIAGYEPPEGLDGVSMLPTLSRSGKQRQHGHLYWEYHSSGGIQAVRMGKWKGVRRRAFRQPGGAVELYDLEADRAETTDLAAEHPEIAARLAHLMAESHSPSELWPGLDPAPGLAERPLISQAGWRLVSVDSESRFNGKVGANAFDGDPDTIWHSEWRDAQPGHPHELVIDLGQERVVRGLRCLPRQDGGTNGRIADYRFHVAATPEFWGEPAAAGKMKNEAGWQETVFAPVKGRYVRLVALSEASGQPFTSIAEIALVGE